MTIQRPAVIETGDARFRLLNDYQHGFPLEPRPFAAIGREIGSNEAAVIETYRNFIANGTVSRIGVVLRPGVLGASVLVALAVPQVRLDEVAALVNRFDEVSHNYQREHAFNMWFVVSAADRDALARIVGVIARSSGLVPLVLPLVEEYHIDLGFDLASAPLTRDAVHADDGVLVDPADEQLARALQPGLALEPAPYARLAESAGLPEAEVLQRVERWLCTGAARRFGVIVRHWELGFRANAMVVWDVPDALAGGVGRALAGEPMVTLAYRRARSRPRWRYNVFAMIHGTDRGAVNATIDAIAARHRLGRFASAVLFSNRRFKQRGARF